jgi:hypothetical protein
MNTQAFVCALAALIASGAAMTQTATQPAQQKPAQQARPAGDAPSSTAPAPTTRDPSSTRGRKDASYPNPSGQDTRTDAAARPHTHEGHDSPADKAVVDPTVSAGPTGKQQAYTGASGKKSGAQAGCVPSDASRQQSAQQSQSARQQSQPAQQPQSGQRSQSSPQPQSDEKSQPARQSQSANPGATTNSEPCRTDPQSSRKAVAPPPGATAPIHQ